ncbi:Topoisomerase V catalytic domain-like protein [Dioscorea alata]|uniref:Topoisomerase V catalytic domain-like protein n=1 Tax=Dioscorea alata TaxID=55571 RepID=A0ACB7UWZ4_DIOAL|nr:Topoisomerase V catalytic domain-like protein [Dioscorea alata]
MWSWTRVPGWAKDGAPSAEVILGGRAWRAIATSVDLLILPSTSISSAPCLQPSIPWPTVIPGQISSAPPSIQQISSSPPSATDRLANRHHSKLCRLQTVNVLDLLIVGGPLLSSIYLILCPDL